MVDKEFDVVVVANGQYPSHPVPLAVLRQAPHVVCCDGAIRHLPDAEVVIGDGDSVPELFRSRLIQIEEQDDNDLTKATRYCISQGWHKIAYLGATGLREDHTLGNISLLMRYYRELHVDGIMFTDHGFFTPASDNRTFSSQQGQQVSVFNFGCTRLSSENLKWPCSPFSQWWQGTLNESISDTFSIHSDGYYLVYQTYTKK